LRVHLPLMYRKFDIAVVAAGPEKRDDDVLVVQKQDVALGGTEQRSPKSGGAGSSVSARKSVYKSGGGGVQRFSPEIGLQKPPPPFFAPNIDPSRTQPRPSKAAAEGGDVALALHKFGFETGCQGTLPALGRPSKIG